jgi:hypothetical protein
MKEYTEYQLRPVETPAHNSMLKGPPDTDIGDLSCRVTKDEDEAVVTLSTWEPTEHQRELIAAGARLSMMVWQHPIPPLALGVEAPFCNCGTEMIWVKNERRFACPQCGERVQTGTYESNSDRPDPHTVAKREFAPESPEDDPPATA